MRKIILMGMALIIMLALLPSCAPGVSQEEYDEVVSDLSEAQTEIQSLQGELSTTQDELSTGEIKDARAIKPLIETLNDDVDRYVRRRAAEALQKIKERRPKEN